MISLQTSVKFSWNLPNSLAAHCLAHAVEYILKGMLSPLIEIDKSDRPPNESNPDKQYSE